jgi:putative Holliday junction resolvase
VRVGAGPDLTAPDPPVSPGFRVAALDLGTKRIGVAISDELLMTVRPLGVIDCVGVKRDAKALREMLAGHDVGLLVMGLPLLDSGEEGESATRARAQGDDLARRLQVRHEYFDESDTTLEAQRILRDGRSSAPVDALAAMLILEEWLQKRQGSIAG